MDYLSRFIAFIVLVILLPFLIIISLILLFFQGSPIFFYHKRVGLNFNSFNLIKFRTMIKNNQNIEITIEGDKRITSLGKFLRKFKIDELPQLLNIIKGDMRFIGPRPEIKEFICLDEFYFLNIIKPGLSDFSSIIFRNEESILANMNSNDPYKKILLPVKIELAQIYSKNKSFKLDLLLSLLTILSIFSNNLIQKFVLNNLVYNYNPKIVEKIKKILRNNK